MPVFPIFVRLLAVDLRLEILWTPEGERSMTNPFIEHRDKVMGYYSTAYWLQGA